jgi:uncharacterized oligopeptide transporter (OPT) family protein
MAHLVNGQPLPNNIAPFIIGSAALFAIPPLLELRFPNSRYLHYIPSGIAFAMGIYTTPNYVIPRVLGSLGAEAYQWYYNRKNPAGARSLKVLVIIIASGFVLGEGTLFVFNIILKACRVEPLTCAGCIYGICSGCK